MVRVLATMLRAIKKFKGKENPESPVATVRHRGRKLKFPGLTTNETREATLELYKEAQATHYGAVVKSFRAGKTEVPHELRKLGLIWDKKDEIIGCRGRHLNWMEYNKKAALILLPAEHFITRRLIEQTHLRLKHTGFGNHDGGTQNRFLDSEDASSHQKRDKSRFCVPFVVESPANSGDKTKCCSWPKFNEPCVQPWTLNGLELGLPTVRRLKNVHFGSHLFQSAHEIRHTHWML
ncbi:hypothetical protein OUZ56_003364 [Daphnia magna]|uniref:Integrase zinc-binding domain-containing protein n=1 Tax=Daphnia magna TaxID=35525 RepID=A0ABR0A8Q3_9CRUS|nr:hypothetical protein OUZ56_003364 [Daphnia magna]